MALNLSDSFMPSDASANKHSSIGTLQIKDIITNETTNVSYEASGKCYKVVDGDTIWVEGVGKIRFVGVNTPEKNEKGYQEAKDFVHNQCYGKTVYLDIDDARNKDKYNRTLAIIYTEDTNINKALLQENLAEIMYIPPSEFSKGLGT
ncbi:thermonuclease family protein [Methanobrevibacter sp. DSM 116169]|uniref:thermonuclease family protein n=1 Tax=Methanobrevibacter sp. DSM 116169 TaxID=3242727 RepID=UPI0038FC842E